MINVSIVLNPLSKSIEAGDLSGIRASGNILLDVFEFLLSKQ
jgi:hypothetical protein